MLEKLKNPIVLKFCFLKYFAFFLSFTFLKAGVMKQDIL